MPRYKVMVLQMMSQTVTVEAESIREAIEQAGEEHDLHPNASNSFDTDGDVQVFNVRDEKGDEVWNEDQEVPE